MRTFQQFIEKVGDFGNPPLPTKENCYGKTVKYAMAPKKKVCALNTDSGSGGSSGDSGGD